MLSLISILELYWNTYVVFTGKDAFTFNMLTLPFHLTEIVLRFFTTYKKDVYLIDDPCLIAKSYLKYNFWVDLISVLPLFAVNNSLLAFKMCRILKFKFYLDYILRMESDLMIRYGAFREGIIQAVQKTTQFFMYLFFAVHLFA